MNKRGSTQHLEYSNYNGHAKLSTVKNEQLRKLSAGFTQALRKIFYKTNTKKSRQSSSCNNFIKARTLSAGFTLLEILITIGIVSLIAFIMIIVGVDTYKRYLSRSDIDTSAILLQRARSSAVNNIGNTSHGVYFGDPDNFILFSGGNSFSDPGVTEDLVIEQNKDITVIGLSEVVFKPLSGEPVTPGMVDIQSDTGNISISINDEGGINW